MTDDLRIADGASVLVLTWGSLAGLLPEIAVLVAFAWIVIKIWESETVRQLTGRDDYHGT